MFFLTLFSCFQMKSFIAKLGFDKINAQLTIPDDDDDEDANVEGESKAEEGTPTDDVTVLEKKGSTIVPKVQIC
jgi:hypothetical protein